MFLILSILFIVLGSLAISNFIKCGSSSPQFSVMDGKFKTKAVNAYSFALHGHKINSNDGVSKELNAVAKYLKENPKRMLNLNGTYYANEKGKNISADNLGLERAGVIEKILLNAKAPEESITISSEMINSLSTSNKNIFNPVEFVFMEKKTDEFSEDSIGDGVGAVRTSVLDPFVIRFETGNNDISMSSELRSYLDEALAYLDSNPDTQLIVTGHTDNKGNASANKKLSLDRASKVRRFLRNNGVKSKQVVAEGKGDSDPIEDNSTEDGRRMNRRVAITIR